MLFNSETFCQQLFDAIKIYKISMLSKEYCLLLLKFPNIFVQNVLKIGGEWNEN
jgi:hypothetical protein